MFSTIPTADLTEFLAVGIILGSIGAPDHVGNPASCD
jgi:hypothetical protein